MTEKQTQSDEVRVYELGYHLISSLDENQVAEVLDELRKELASLGANFIAEGEPELIDLAYTMSINEGGKHIKYDKAYFGWIKFELEPEKVVTFEKEVLTFNKNILRYLLIKTVREDTRAQLKEEALRALEEVKTTGTIERKEDVEEREALSEEEIDKAVEELLAQPDVAGATEGTEEVRQAEEK